MQDTLKITVSIVVDLDVASWELNYGVRPDGWTDARWTNELRGNVREDARSAVEVDIARRGIEATVR